MKRDIVVEVVYPHPPERVWQALTEPRAIGAWLMENDFSPLVGYKFQFRTKPQPGFNGIVDCKVLEVDPPRRLSYSWQGGSMSHSTVVTYILDPVPGGTRLRLEHRGFRGFKDVAISFFLSSGWKRHILRNSLPALLDRMAAGEFAANERRAEP